MEKLDWLLEQDEEILTADGFDYALIGTCERAGGNLQLLCMIQINV